MVSHIPRKRFGQHFLRDQTIIQRIITALGAKPGEPVVEIGPGLGALTTELLPRIGRLEVVEFDRDLIPELTARCKGLGELIVHQADALKFDFGKVATQAASLHLIGNLPYNISTPLIFHLLENTAAIKDMLFMLQKEVAERIVAHPGHKDYGRLSIMVQYFCQTEILFSVPPAAFNPPPKVNSAVIRLIPYRQLPFIAQDFERFAEIVRLAFGQRRKTLRNSLQTLVSKEQLQKIGIDPELRAEKLSVEDYVKIANN